MEGETRKMNIETILNSIDKFVSIIIAILLVISMWHGYTLKIGDWLTMTQRPIKDSFKKKGDKKNDN